MSKYLFSEIISDSFKESLFRETFKIMSEDMKDSQRKLFQMASMEWSFRNLKKLGFSPKIIIDIGAYKGGWTEIAKSIFPDAYVFMIEAQSSKEEYLKQVQQKYPHSVDCIISLLGAQSQKPAKFYEMETGSSVLEEQSTFCRTAHMLPMETLDDIVAKRKLEEVSFLKLDIQGYELEVLKGATNTLKNVEVILMEVSLLGINKGAPLLDEVIQVMKNKLFLVYDICSFIRRPLDDALWQTDIIFVRQGSNLIKNQNYN